MTIWGNHSTTQYPDLFHAEVDGKNAYELTQMVEAGMPPMAAIVAATRNAAAALGKEAELGTLEAGKIADLLLVDGDPIADISVLEDQARTALVMREGRIAVDRRRADGRDRSR